MSFIDVTVRRGAVLLVVLAMLAATAVPAAAAPLTRRGNASSIGKFASVSVNGLEIARPGQIQFRVMAAPNQRVTVRWSMHCELPNFRSASRSADRTGRSTVRFAPALPPGNLSQCSVSASADFPSFDRGGRITLEVWARRR